MPSKQPMSQSKRKRENKEKKESKQESKKIEWPNFSTRRMNDKLAWQMVSKNMQNPWPLVR